MKHKNVYLIYLLILLSVLPNFFIPTTKPAKVLVKQLIFHLNYMLYQLFRSSREKILLELASTPKIYTMSVKRHGFAYAQMLAFFSLHVRHIV